MFFSVLYDIKTLFWPSKPSKNKKKTDNKAKRNYCRSKLKCKTQVFQRLLKNIHT